MDAGVGCLNIRFRSKQPGLHKAAVSRTGEGPPIANNDGIAVFGRLDGREKGQVREGS